MAGMKVRVNTADLRKFKASMARLNEKQLKQWSEAAVKDLAAQLLAKVIDRTPVGKYPKDSGKTGGTLRKAWIISEVRKTGDSYTIEVINPMTYAPYVEFGHRQTPGRYVPAIGKQLKSNWVEGRFMLTVSEAELQADAPTHLMNRLNKFMREVFR
jgi:hypothetical protein